MIVTKLIHVDQLPDFVLANESHILLIDDIRSVMNVEDLITLLRDFKVVTLEFPAVNSLQLMHDEAFDRKENK